MHFTANVNGSFDLFASSFGSSRSSSGTGGGSQYPLHLALRFPRALCCSRIGRRLALNQRASASQ
ncbi:hypothetical protein BG57_20715 [Caballeronia grimmiae]|uniref:Uncharacterized protein n=1 Tax=Caballeronia grimmiae TaxID=1071679 RepID=A0A069PG82_9BURK|nr:hypothetical protein BG57_20715 [Caballeronia grimmiae]